MILGSNALNDLGMILNYDQNFIKWDNTRVLMKSRLKCKDSKDSSKIYYLFATLANEDKPLEIKFICQQTKGILDVVYKKADIKKIV